MTDSTLVYSKSLKTQRETLRHQRRLKAWQGIWRFFALCGLTGGLLWLLSWPHWLIHQSSQVKITGNKLLSAEKIRNLLNVKYPQSVWQLPIDQLTEELKESPPIEDIYIARKVLPSQITINVKERQPVAKAFSSQGMGYLDATGVWISQEFYGTKVAVATSQKFTVLGFEQQYRSHWMEIYPLIVASPVKITTVDWRNPSNLILKTELGMVHLGPFSDRLAKQLQTLAKMRKLPSRVPTNRISYLDLSNPDAPSVRLKPQPQKQI
ncbi:MAG TPA: cell division protein FtsQ [Cyanothece sp. UBA12306]|nr:cell division protein FtsQ [Cyanothece sp. UBA12306]